MTAGSPGPGAPRPQPGPQPPLLGACGARGRVSFRLGPSVTVPAGEGLGSLPAPEAGAAEAPAQRTVPHMDRIKAPAPAATRSPGCLRGASGLRSPGPPGAWALPGRGGRAGRRAAPLWASVPVRGWEGASLRGPQGVCPLARVLPQPGPEDPGRGWAAPRFRLFVSWEAKSWSPLPRRSPAPGPPSASRAE